MLKLFHSIGVTVVRLASIGLLWVGLIPQARAQQGSTITLSCNRTSKATTAADLKPDPIKNLGIIVNSGDRTVTFMDYVMPLTGITATLVSFSGRQTILKQTFTIDGSIDRVTGHTEIDWMYEVVGNNSHWELACRPATRLF